MMTVRLIAHTPEPEKVVAAAAKLCYSDAHITDLLDGLTEEKTAKFLTMLSDLGHASPIEHASFTFGIEGVSRTLLAQITRHRIASFSVQSQRYVRLDDFRYVVPPEIEAIPEAKEAFLASMEEDAKRYLDLAHKLEEGHTARLMAEGMPEKQARAKASKQAEARRRGQQQRQAWLERYSTCLNGCGKPVAFWDDVHLSLRYGGCCSAECESSYQARRDADKREPC